MDQQTVLNELREVLHTDISVINEQMIMREYWITCRKITGKVVGFRDRFLSRKDWGALLDKVAINPICVDEESFEHFFASEKHGGVPRAMLSLLLAGEDRQSGLLGGLCDRLRKIEECGGAMSEEDVHFARFVLRALAEEEQSPEIGQWLGLLKEHFEVLSAPSVLFEEIDSFGSFARTRARKPPRKAAKKISRRLHREGAYVN